MSAPSIRPAAYSTMSNGDLRVARREYVRAIIADDEVFHVNSFHINPGKEMFPWLSQVSDNFEEYVFEKLSFEYKPVISSATYSGSMGSVVCAVLYNAGASDLDTYPKIVEYSGSVEKRICDPLFLKVNVSKNTHAGEDHYIRTGGVPIGEDIKTYDIGKLNVATDHVSSSFPAGTLLGHIYADYVVILRKPKLKTHSDPANLTGRFGYWVSDDCEVDNSIAGYRTSTLTTYNADLTVLADPRAFSIKLPGEGTYYVCIVAKTNASTNVGVAGAGFAWLNYASYDGATATTSCSQTTGPYVRMISGYISVTDSALDEVMTLTPISAGIYFTAWNVTFMEMPEGSLSWLA